MALSFREVVRDDQHLLNILELAIVGDPLDGAIEISDINGICAKITTINTTNPKSYSRRIAWTVTGRLLIGLTTFYDFQVRICLEESQRLKESCLRHTFGTQPVLKTKTTKRKIKRVTVESNKRTRIEIDEEIVEYWDEPLEYDPNFELPIDPCLVVNDEQITLREIPVVTIDTYSESDDDFGDNDQGAHYDK